MLGMAKRWARTSFADLVAEVGADAERTRGSESARRALSAFETWDTATAAEQHSSIETLLDEARPVVVRRGKHSGPSFDPDRITVQAGGMAAH